MPQQLSEAAGSIFNGILNRKVPFTIFLEVIPIRGKRFETIRDLQREADRVENALDEDVCTDGLTFDFSRPIAITPQIGNNPSRLTLTGHFCILSDSELVNAPVGEQLVINAGENKEGPSPRNGFREPDVVINDLVKEFRSRIETITGLAVLRLEFSNIIFGSGGFHFPV